MASFNSHRNSFVLRSITNKPPKHHIMKIVSFSRYRSGCIVTIDYKFFLLNRHWKNYLVLEDANKEVKKYRVYKTIIGGLAGFDRFIPLEDFSDASNSYLVDDTCKFGAEVFVSKRRRKCAGDLHKYVNLNTVTYKYVWMIPNFSKLYAESAKKYKSNNSWLHKTIHCCRSGQKYCKWILMLYSEELDDAKYFSLGLGLFEPETYLPTGSKVLAEVTVCILDQIYDQENYYFQGQVWFSDLNWCYGAYNGMTHETLGRLLKSNSCIITAEIVIREIIIPISTP
ncbi:hypothetical protein M0R45_023474 [Rubus argutus]|uniref:MATH domain-containing protein n=1 Tax=Rubus argutus TaxID=59490 RepID=A0AAW1WRG4_RUBAR